MFFCGNALFSNGYSKSRYVNLLSRTSKPARFHTYVCKIAFILIVLFNIHTLGRIYGDIRHVVANKLPYIWHDSCARK